MAVATRHKYCVSLETHIVIARYRRLMLWRYKYSSSLFDISSSPFSLVIHRRGVYPFGLLNDLIGFDLTLEISVSRFSDLKIMRIAAFRLLLSVLESAKRLRLRASLAIDVVCLYKFAGTS